MPKFIADDTAYVGSLLNYGGAGTWVQSGYDASAYGTSWHFNATPGATFTVVLPPGYGYTGICFVSHATYVPAVMTISVNGGAAVQAMNWNGGDATDASAATHYPNEYQCTWGMTQFASPGAAQTVVVTLISGALIIDAVEFYVAEPTLNATLAVLGHSIAQGVYGDGTSGPGCMGYLATLLGISQVNNALNGEGISCATPGVATPGWKRIFTGAGTNLWDDLVPRYATAMYSYNEERAQNPAVYGAGFVTAMQSYYQTMYVNRMEDLLVRMTLRSPQTVILIPGMTWGVTLTPSYGWLQASYNFGYPGVPPANYVGTYSGPAYTNNAVAWNQALMQMALGGAYPGAIFVDTYQDTAGGGGFNITPDGSHPNDQGHLLIAKRLYAGARRSQQRGGMRLRGWT